MTISLSTADESQDPPRESGPVSPASPRTDMKSKRKSLFASGIGNVLEWYEWSAYAVFAPFIAAVMFNPDNQVSALLSTFAVFAVGFLMRPLGGIVFGRIADKKGRKFVLVTTMMLMATGSLIIGVMPTYESVGVFASAILLLARVLQGFAHGGESATAYSYVGEIAPPNRRGMWGSVTFIAIFGGSVLAYTLGGAITSTLSETAVGEWGWRIPFLLGAVLALVALYIRRNMEESDVFHEEDTAIAPEPVDKKVLARAILLMIGMTSGITAAHYTWSSYISTFAITEKGMDPDTAYWALVVAQVIAIVSLPLFGRLSDSIGRRPMLAFFAIAMAALQFPLTAMITDAGWTLLLATTIALLIISVPACVLSATLSEAFPTRVRTAGIGFAYSFSVAVFGGTAPYLNQLFTNHDVGWIFHVYVILLSLATGVACLIMKETRGANLKEG